MNKNDLKNWFLDRVGNARISAELLIEKFTPSAAPGPIDSFCLKQIRTQVKYSHLDTAQEWVAIAMQNPKPDSPDNLQDLYTAMITQLRAHPDIPDEFITDIETLTPEELIAQTTLQKTKPETLRQ